MWLVILLVLASLVFGVAGSSARKRESTRDVSRSQKESTLEVLKRQYVDGEIDLAAYEAEVERYYEQGGDESASRTGSSEGPVDGRVTATDTTTGHPYPDHGRDPRGRGSMERRCRR